MPHIAEERPASRFGASLHGGGADFGLFSAHAEHVQLCLFSADGASETDRIGLTAQADGLWHTAIPGISAGQLYGYRVDGPFIPDRGHLFNPNKLLVDPYGQALSGRIRWHDALYGHVRGTSPMVRDTQDSAPFMPKSVVPAPGIDPAPEHSRPQRSWHETLIYEAHVKGLTQLHPDIPPALRGSYEALAHPAIIDHLLRLQVTAVELLPIQAFVDDHALVTRGLSNFWGYQPLGYFAPEARYFGPNGPEGLKAAIRTLHEHGIEVILDVVYNHTGEGDADGPTLCYRGIDNASYYKHAPGDPGRLWEATGCGNMLDLTHPRVRQLAVDSLRHWADAYGIDGFRFDLAAALAREPYAYTERATFFAALADDPVLGGLKLIAEPWDTREGGWQTGNFPPGWSDWNDRARDSVRSFWRGDAGQLPRLTQSLAGSKEMFQAGGRLPGASVNFVCCHDGFTLRDLVSYAGKHNEANGESNTDGSGENLSANYGQEGPSDDPAILAVRGRQVRNMLATIFLAQGVPMLLAGDELSRTQAGNNNAYCQDNETSWLDWTGGRALDPALPDFVANLSGLRRNLDGLRRHDFLDGLVDEASGLKDVYWLDETGAEMTGETWGEGGRLVMGVQLGNDADDGRRILYLLNASAAPVAFRLAADFPSRAWRPAFDTTVPDGLPDGAAPGLEPGGTFTLAPRSVVLFQHAA